MYLEQIGKLDGEKINPTEDSVETQTEDEGIDELLANIRCQNALLRKIEEQLGSSSIVSGEFKSIVKK